MNDNSATLNLSIWTKLNYACARFFSNFVIWSFLIYILIGVANRYLATTTRYVIVILYLLPIAIGAILAIKGWKNCNLVHGKIVDEKFSAKISSAQTYIAIGNILILLSIFIVIYSLFLPAGSGGSGIILGFTIFPALFFYIAVTNFRELIKSVLIGSKQGS